MNEKITRVWAMPNKNTFDIPPIGHLVKRYLVKSAVSIDPFARDKCWATYTNDLNPDTKAQYHMDALEFLHKIKSEGIRADLVILDPPYSLRQIQECYEGIGRAITAKESQRFYADVKDIINTVVQPGGRVLSFGWNSIGMGIGRGYQIEEILLVCHGRAHNDTICVVEQRVDCEQVELAMRR